MEWSRVKEAGKRGLLAAIGVALIGVGVGMIEKGEVVAGGILAGVGAVILMVSDYLGR